MTVTASGPTAHPDTGFPRAGSLVDAADAHPVVAAARAHADEVLRPGALRTDRDGVSAEQITRLAELGLLNHAAPAEFGGAGLDRNADRRIHEIISGADFNLWLVWAQHASLISKLTTPPAPGAPPPPRDFSPLARQALSGEILLGAAVSDVRRYPEHYITATRSDDGWRFTGTISWVSGWGLNKAIAVAAVEPGTGTVVTALVPVGEAWRASPLGLAAVGGSRTLRVRIDDVPAQSAQVLSEQTFDQWRAADIALAADARPQIFGLARTVLDELDAADEPLASAVAGTWRPRIDQFRSDAYGLADEARVSGVPDHRVQDRLDTKVAAGEALSTLTRALLVARSGRGLAGDNTAQYYARSALFALVQGQNPDVRDAQLTRLAR